MELAKWIPVLFPPWFLESTDYHLVYLEAGEHRIGFHDLLYFFFPILLHWPVPCLVFFFDLFSFALVLTMFLCIVNQHKYFLKKRKLKY